MDSERHELLKTQYWSMPFRLFRRDIAEGYEAHWHSQMELHYIESGTMHCVIGSTPVEANAGDLLIINANELHFFSPSDAVFICLHVPEDFFSVMNVSGIRFQTLLRGSGQVKRLFEEMTARMAMVSPGDGFFIVSRIYALFAFLIDSPQAYRLSSREAARTANRDAAFRQILTTMRTHYAEDLSTAELAQSVFLSEAYFCRYFRSYTGESPLRYLQRLRMNKAAERLRNTEESITDIAQAVGYADSNYFSRIFRSFFGQSPAAYRDACRKAL